MKTLKNAIGCLILMAASIPTHAQSTYGSFGPLLSTEALAITLSGHLVVGGTGFEPVTPSV